MDPLFFILALWFCVLTFSEQREIPHELQDKAVSLEKKLAWESEGAGGKYYLLSKKTKI